MAKQAKKKQSYGGCTVARFSPEVGPTWPTAVNVVLTFEEAMKLSLSLQHRLLDINALNRSTREGKAQAVNLCLYPDRRRMTVNAGKA
jgi:hypothetical protein